MTDQYEVRHLTEFYYHKVSNEDTIVTMAEIRKAYIALAKTVSINVPNCRSKSLALTDLESSLMRATQALAVHNGELIEEQ